MATAITEFDGEHRFLSNFYDAPITDRDGRVWPTVEHAFQAMKTLDFEQREHVRGQSSPGRAKRAGRRVTLRANWDAMRLDVMERIVRAKFRQYPELANKLMATRDALLVEGNTWNDTFWGQCGGRGENHLGEILMDVREDLQRRART